MVTPFRLSIHEAGHVVVATALGFRVSEVTITEAGGHVRFHAPLGVPIPNEAEVVILLAGREAELIAFGDSTPSLEDLAEARASLSRFDADRIERELVAAALRARTILTARSTVLWACALRLQKSGGWSSPTQDLTEVAPT